MHSQDLLSTAQVGVADGDLPVEAARAQQGGIENVRTVRGRHHDDALRLREAVHLDEQLIERLLALFVGQGRSAAIAANRIELVDEDDARLVATRIAEQPSHARAPTPAYISTKSEPLAEMNGTPASPAIDRASSVFPVPGGPDEQDAARNAAADGGKARRILQELDDLTHLVLRFVNAGNVRKGHGTVSGSIVLVRSSVGTRPVIMRTRTRPAIPNNRKPTATAPYRPALNDCAWRTSRRMPRWASPLTKSDSRRCSPAAPPSETAFHRDARRADPPSSR